MKVEQIFEEMQLLFENFEALEAAFEDAIDTGSTGEFDRKFEIMISNNINRIETNGRLVGMRGGLFDIYKQAVRNNLPFPDVHDIRNPRDAGEWIRALRSRNPNAAKNAAMRFVNAVRRMLEEFQERKDWKENEGNFSVVHKSSNFVMFKVHHEAAACKLGTNADWCVSTTNRARNLYNSYSEQSHVYVIHSARKEKFAILVSKNDSSKIVEVQNADNDLGWPFPSTLKRFTEELREAGIDPEEIEQVLGIEIIQPANQRKDQEAATGQEMRIEEIFESPQHDREFRQRADGIYRQLIRELDRGSHSMFRAIAGGQAFLVRSTDLGVSEPFELILRKIEPGSREIVGGFDLQTRRLHVFVDLKKDLVEQLSSRTYRDTIIHELIHLFDSERMKVMGRTAGLNDEDYFNSPVETNAYYQEALSALENVVEKVRDNPKVHQNLIRQWKTFPGFYETFEVFMDSDFKRHMNTNTQRKIKTRVFKYWNEALSDFLGER